MAQEQRVPTGDSATNNAWTAQGGGSKYVEVDDTIGAPDDATTYNYRQNSNDNQSFTFSAFTVPGGSTINWVRVTSRTWRTTAGGMNTVQLMVVGGTNREGGGTNNNPAETWKDTSNDWLTNPNTASAWTVAEVNGTDGTNDLEEFGCKTNGLGAGEEIRCTQNYCTVDYTAAATGNPKGVFGLALDGPMRRAVL